MSRRIAIIGYGAIGREVVGRLARSSAGPFEQAVLLRPGSPSAAELPTGVGLLESFEDLASFTPDLVVEAAGVPAARTYAGRCLAAGFSIVVSSVGTFADDAVPDDRMGDAMLVIPSGAIAALDYLRAVRSLDGVTVGYESRKPPAAWRDDLVASGHDPDALAEPVVLFSGTAREAARRYPRNLNVAATIALACKGLDDTGVRVVADPAAEGNTHSITVDSPAGRMRTEIVNNPMPANPRTSWLTALSVVATVEDWFGTFRIGT